MQARRTPEVDIEFLKCFEERFGGRRGELLKQWLRESCNRVSLSGCAADSVTNEDLSIPSMKKRCAAPYCCFPFEKSRIMRSTFCDVGMRRYTASMVGWGSR